MLYVRVRQKAIFDSITLDDCITGKLESSILTLYLYLILFSLSVSTFQISSSEHFGGICPPSLQNRELCIVFLISDDQKGQKLIKAMRNFLKQSKGHLLSLPFNFSYLYYHRQQEFLSSFKSPTEHSVSLNFLLFYSVFI